MLNLRARILMVLAGTALAFLVAVYAIGRATLLPSFLELEAAHAVANLERGTAALQNGISLSVTSPAIGRDRMIPTRL